MDTKIPNRGAFTLPMREGESVDVWYERSSRMWFLRTIDSGGNQTGPGDCCTAEFYHDRGDAVSRARELVEQCKPSISIIVNGPPSSDRRLIATLVAQALAEAGLRVTHDGLTVQTGTQTGTVKRALRVLGVIGRSTVEVNEPK